MIAIIDYGMGNLRSVQKAFEHVGTHGHRSPTIRPCWPTPRRWCSPASAHFATPSPRCETADSSSRFARRSTAGKPFLGICLGLQLLFDRSFEDGEYQGLGVVPAKWCDSNCRRNTKCRTWAGTRLQFRRRPPIFAGIDEGAHFYFVHSYYVVPRDESIVATQTDYPQPFCSSIWRDNLFATQFHPEKSQATGLRVLKNFAELA